MAVRVMALLSGNLDTLRYERNRPITPWTAE
jgi:hypothetical protein